MDEEHHPILNTSTLDLSGSFDMQVEQLLSKIRLTKEEVENIDCLLRDLVHNFRQIWPGCRLELFGSIITGLGIKTSDVDCLVSLPSWETKPPNKLVYKAYDSLFRQPYVFGNLQAIARAKVPIVKFKHIPTMRNCDASFKTSQGVRNSALLCFLLHLDRRALNLAIIIKYWAKVHKLTGTNFMPNYGLTLLTVFYLQQVNILPPVSELQKRLQIQQRWIIDGWDTAFEKIDHYTPKGSKNDADLYDLLGGFFEFYSNFSFAEDVISVFTGCSLKKDLFRNVGTVPSIFRLYHNHVSNRSCRPLRIDMPMCVQDPFDHSRNCTVAVSKALMPRIETCIRAAAKHFKEVNNADFLNAILLKVAVVEDIFSSSLVPIVNPPQRIETQIIDKFVKMRGINKRKKKNKFVRHRR